MIHECLSCGRSYYCNHKNCGYVLNVQCDECNQKHGGSTRQRVEDAIAKSKGYPPKKWGERS